MKTRKEVRQKIADYIKSNPDVPYREIAAKLGCSITVIGTIARQHGISRHRKALSLADLSKLEG